MPFSPPKSAYLLAVTLQSPFLQPQAIIISSVSMDQPILDILYNQNLIICGQPLSFSGVFKVNTCCSQYEYFIPFYCQIMFHCKGIQHFVYLFTSWWIFGLFPLLAIMNNATMNIYQTLCRHMFSVHSEELPDSSSRWLAASFCISISSG